MSNTEALRAATEAVLSALDKTPVQNMTLEVHDRREALRAALAQPAASDEPDDAHPLYQRGWKAGYKHGAWQARHCAAQPAPTSRLKWMEAPRRSEWGAGMMEALAALGPDETLRLYAHRDAVPMADALLSAQPAPARVPLTHELIREARQDAVEVFGAEGRETPQIVRDVIEYMTSWMQVYADKAGTPSKEAPHG